MATLPVYDVAYQKSYSWFRCEEMALCQLYLQSESAYNITAVLGEYGICQFRDLNTKSNAFQRKFVSEVRRCNDMERQLAMFETQLKRDKIPSVSQEYNGRLTGMKDIAELERQLESVERELTDVNRNCIELKLSVLKLAELREILKRVDEFHREAQDLETARNTALRRMSVVDPDLMRRFSIVVAAQSEPNFQIPLDPVVDIITLAGTIKVERKPTFQKSLWRITHGNILLEFFEMPEPLEDPVTGEMQYKCIFILVCQGAKLHDKCQKICNAYHATLYPFPTDNKERNQMLARVITEMSDVNCVLSQTNDHRKKTLAAIATKIMEWKMMVIKFKTVHETMNLFSDTVSGQCLVAECWIPRARIGDARMALQQGQSFSNSDVPSVLSTIPTTETPPTYNVTNKFTAGFQNIIDSYGCCSYGEVNPAPYSIITFPFLFAVMFGDTGHGILMALFAVWMIWKEKNLASVRGEIFSMFFSGRYIILLMGSFSIYTGLIYNDIFSKSMNPFGTAFRKNISGLAAECPHDDFTCRDVFVLQPSERLAEGYQRYPFGLDPVWQISINKVLYLNAYKMKLSVVLGVLQMLFGVVLGLFNHVFYRKWISVFVEFIPQIIFLLAIFGYMNFMIFFKWLAYTDSTANCAPSILITLINMFMFKRPSDEDPCYLKDEMFPGQFDIQAILIIIAFLCVPVMLIVKPVYQHVYNNKNKHSTKSAVEDSTSFELQENGQSASNHQIVEETASPLPDVDGHGDSGESFGDAFINQAIHTIEYCLGSVSHTASYLRLWALSLAHAQLSEVLWNMVMHMGFMEQPLYISGPFMFIIFSAWACLTVAILIVMEGLSAFLHALRLHWVEFMSKFYHGAGYPFQPLWLRKIIDANI